MFILGSTTAIPARRPVEMHYTLPSLSCRKMQRNEDVSGVSGVSASLAAGLSWAVHPRQGPQDMQQFICLMNCPERHKENKRLLPYFFSRSPLQPSSSAALPAPKASQRCTPILQPCARNSTVEHKVSCTLASNHVKCDYFSHTKPPSK